MYKNFCLTFQQTVAVLQNFLKSSSKHAFEDVFKISLA